MKNVGCTQIVRRSLLSDSSVHLLATDEEILTKNLTGAIRFSYNVRPRCLKRIYNYINNPLARVAQQPSGEKKVKLASSAFSEAYQMNIARGVTHDSMSVPLKGLARRNNGLGTSII